MNNNKRSRGTGSLYRPTYTAPDGERKTAAIWWCAYSQRGQSVRESTGETDRRKAEKFLIKRLGLVAVGRVVGPSVDRTTLGDLCSMLTADYETNGKRAIAIKAPLDHLRNYFGENCRASGITSDGITKYIAERQKDGAANGTINRSLAALKHAFALAARAQKVASRPYIAMLEENNARQGFLSHSEFEALRDALPNDLKDPVAFLYYSGWRINEVRTLEWRDVDLEGSAIRLRPENSKSKTGRTLPLRGELAEIMQRALGRRRLDCPNVFLRDGGPIGAFRKTWASACKKAGLGHVLVHDFRRTAVRNLIRSRTPERVAMLITGHKTRSVFDRYNIVTESDIGEAIERVSEYLGQMPPVAPTVVPFHRTA
jgi:integrase